MELTTRPPLRVVVVGAGIGGLATALSLRAAHHEVVVLEQANRLGDVGAGLALTPNAVLVTRMLGIGERLAGFAVRPTHMIRRRWADGAVLGSLPLVRPDGEDAGAPYWHVHRADLHRVLWEAAEQHVPSRPRIRLHLGARVDRLDERAGGVAAVTVDGTRFEADLVVGADGIHSVVRDHVGDTADPVHSGDMAFRALVPRDDIDADLGELFGAHVLTNWLGPERHVVHYYVRGGSLLNIVAVVPGDHDRTESWSRPGDPQDLVKAFTGWDGRLARLLERVRETARWALYDRPPLAHWSRGRVGLLGDACHAMLPYQAQGGAQTLEDAVALGRVLTGVDRDGVAAALAEYEETRKPRTSALQVGARANGDLYHLPDGPAQRLRDEELGRGAGEFGALPTLWAPVY